MKVQNAVDRQMNNWFWFHVDAAFTEAPFSDKRTSLKYFNWLKSYFGGPGR
jgi:hypothetical protein